MRSDGSLDRPALAQIIFHDEPARAFVNGLVHPVVRARSAEIERTAAADRIVVHEIPLLFETGFAEQCDATIVVIAPRELRIARAMARNDVTRDEVERRIAAQIDPADARSLADYVIENDGTLDGLRERTERVYRSLQAR